MTPAEFVERCMALPGLPWVRWRSDWQACDCFGLIALWHREVLGIDLGPVPQTDIATGFFEASGWVQCDPEAGATAFMSWRNGAPTHCGILLDGERLLHAQEGHPIAEHGTTRITRLEAMRRAALDLRFYLYTGAAC